MSPVRIATRASRQATTQANVVADRLRAAGVAAELVLIDTKGDRTQADDVPLHTIGGQGVFVKEIQRAVLDQRADIAVHSAKDMPTDPVEGLTLAAFTARRTPADAMIGSTLDALAHGATVATGSVRRRAQLARVRPDLHFVELRGNIDTRLTKIPAGGAIVMAVAALEVLGLTDHIAEQLDPTVFVPAVGQGCVAVECRDDDSSVLAALATIDDAQTRAAVEVERAFLDELGSGCSLPIGAHAIDQTLHLFLAGTAATVCRRVPINGSAASRHHQARAAATAALAAVGSL